MIRSPRRRAPASRRRGAASARRSRIALLACALAALLALVAACANEVGGSGRVVGISTTDPTSVSPSGAPTQTVSPSSSAYSVVCPNIVDNEARLSYTCVDNSLRINPITASQAGLTVALETSTEPGWVAMQGSGHAASVSGATAQMVAQKAASDNVSQSYGTSPTSTVQKQGEVKLGRSAYRIDTLVTINPKYADQEGLKVKQELLSVTVVEVAQGTFSLLLITVPDTEKVWWQDYDDVVSSLRVI